MPPSSLIPHPSSLRNDAGGRRFALAVAVAAMAVTMVPYLYGWNLTGARPLRGWFSWLGYNLDDSCVYLAWMRQAADGALFQRNLFTTEPQLGHQLNLFFLALGNLARLLHLPLLLVYHAARLALGVAFLRAVWWLLERLLADGRARRAAYLVVCFSAGLGWLPGLWRRDGILSPVDVWQPESTTFLCLYLSPLFLVSLLLMVGVIGWLFIGDKQKSFRPAIYAGLCGLLLGNIHTYDVITLTAVWGGYLVVRGVVERQFDAGSWGRALVAGALTLPTTAYTAWLVKHEQVFAQRVAVQTLSPAISLYVLGYGLVLLLALGGVWLLAWQRAFTREEGDTAAGPRAALLLVVWAVANLGAAYLPVPYQRKMLMGEHLPLAILAGIALAADLPLLRRMRGRAWSYALAAAVLLLSLTNLRFMRRDMENFDADRGQTGIQRPYMYAGEVAALEWLRQHAPPGAPIQPLPWIWEPVPGKIGPLDTTVACFAPGLTGHPVNAGHWGETPEFGAAIGRWVRFVRPDTPAAERLALLRDSGVRYVVFTQKHDEEFGGAAASSGLLSRFLSSAPPPGLRLLPEASNPDADVYEVTGD